MHIHTFTHIQNTHKRKKEKRNVTHLHIYTSTHRYIHTCTLVNLSSCPLLLLLLLLLLFLPLLLLRSSSTSQFLSWLLIVLWAAFFGLFRAYFHDRSSFRDQSTKPVDEELLKQRWSVFFPQALLPLASQMFSKSAPSMCFPKALGCKREGGDLAGPLGKVRRVVDVDEAGRDTCSVVARRRSTGGIPLRFVRRTHGAFLLACVCFLAVVCLPQSVFGQCR